MKKVLILLLALSLTGCSSTQPAATKGEVVDCAEVSHVAAKPGDTLLNCLTGSEKISVESLRGPLIVNVWGSWCGPCADEMPIFVDFNNQAKGKVKLLGIVVESTEELIELTNKYLKVSI
jgi:thiol-disulfide isomerase/thioredoxin